MLHPVNESSASHLLTILAKKISQCSGDERETARLFIPAPFCFVAAIQQHSASHYSFIREDCPE